MKPLKSLVRLFNLPSSLDLTITAITTDSRLVKPGTLFCAVKGHSLDGFDFIADAINAGASAVFCERPLLGPDDRLRRYQDDGKVFVIPDLYHRLGELADFFYDQPSQKLNVIGVTGTNGKTSTTHYVSELLHLLGEKSALIGTVGNGLWGHLSTSERTTPDVLSLHQTLRDFANQGVKWVAMEVSSHALDQNRVDAVRFHSAIFTNLTQDHLDYHKTMEDYGAAKAKLFQRPELKIAVLNEEDPFSQTIVKHIPLTTKCFFYGAKPTVKTNLIGSFNISNLNAALTLLAASGFFLKELETRASLLHAVKGRMEGLRYPDAPLVVIDYAHTPDALAKAVGALKAYDKKLWVVFGCGGDRDPTKRPLMAKAVEPLADEIIVTEDNSRTESIESIFAGIQPGFAKPQNVHFINDRTKAIHFALKNAKPEDIVLLAGKGHETYLDKHGVKTHYDEREVVSSLLKRKY